MKSAFSCPRRSRALTWSCRNKSGCKIRRWRRMAPETRSEPCRARLRAWTCARMAAGHPSVSTTACRACGACGRGRAHRSGQTPRRQLAEHAATGCWRARLCSRSGGLSSDALSRRRASSTTKPAQNKRLGGVHPSREDSPSTQMSCASAMGEREGANSRSAALCEGSREGRSCARAPLCGRLWRAYRCGTTRHTILKELVLIGCANAARTSRDRSNWRASWEACLCRDTKAREGMTNARER